MLHAAFPAGLAADVDRVAASLPHARYPPTEDCIGPIRIGGEPLRIPYRVYFPELSPPAALTETQRRIWSCVYSRHHDGRVRERNLGLLLDADDGWITPFVVQLLGEYVLEIVQLIDSRRDVLDRTQYRQLVIENAAFLRLTKQRAVSYWNCYHWRQFRRKEDYPGFRLICALEPAP